MAPNYPTGHFKDSPFIQYYDNISTGKRGNGRKSLGVNNNMQLLVMLTPESFADFIRTPITSIAKPVTAGAKSLVSPTTGTSECAKTIDAVTSASLAGVDGLFLQDLYFVSKDSLIEGVTSKQSSWALHKIASSLEFDNQFSNPAPVYELRERLQAKIPHRFSTLELLHLYGQYGCSEQVFLVGKFPK